VVGLLFEQSLHGPVEADEGAAKGMSWFHSGKLRKAIYTSRMEDVYLRKQ